MDTELFKKASLHTKKWRLLLRGTSGSGKTTSALILANELKGAGRIALVDTEKMSSTHNASKFDFDVIDYNTWAHNNHSIKGYLHIIDQAEKAGYSVLIIDSFSHAWIGHGGILETVDSIAQTKYKGNTYRAWNDGNAMYQELIDKILFGNNMHIILTARTKQAYELAEGKVFKKGMDMQQRDGLEYEFDISLSFENSKPGYAVVDKDRTGLFDANGEMITPETGKKLLNYLGK